MASHNSRVLLLGLDGATFDLLLPLIEQGKLPCLKKILSLSAYGTLNSTIPCTTPVAWSSVFTGKNPGKHGIFDFWESYHFDQHRPLISLKSLKATPFWRILNSNDKVTILFNVPLTYPPEPLNGAMISGMMTPSEESCFTYPSELKDDLLSKFPDYKVNIDIPQFDTEYYEDCIGFLRAVEKSFKVRCDVLLYIMKNNRWDLLFAVFVLPDRIQHLLWKYIDPNDSRFREDEKGRYIYDYALRLFQMLDDMICILQGKLKESDYLFIISDHGFGGTEAYINVNTLLQNWDYLKFKKTILGKKAFFRLWQFGDSRFAKGVIPARVQRSIRAKIKRKRSSFNSELEGIIDYGKTKAFFASIASQGIYINRRNSLAEPSENSKEYRCLRDNIRNNLKSLKLDRDGKALFDSILYPEEIYKGPYVKQAPDIILTARNYSYLGRQHIGAPGIISDFSGKPNGFHRPNGIFIAYGPGITHNLRFDSANLKDIAPTVLYLNSCPIPADIDGKVLSGIFTENFLKDHSIKLGINIDPEDDCKGVFTADESEEIQKRLKGLGYIE
ncbi:MAG: hypothetical protein GY855_04800 [candidate division Zixibacteria bacterium]|nr:hypothetical protein [candidate division Zixibacteria bacterium]